jgi:hypothetical protein
MFLNNEDGMAETLRTLIILRDSISDQIRASELRPVYSVRLIAYFFCSTLQIKKNAYCIRLFCY